MAQWRRRQPSPHRAAVPPTTGMWRDERKHQQCSRRSNHRRHHDQSGTTGIRESFFTKWLFVCSLSNESKVLRAFTLDSRVRASLKTIGWPDAALRKTLRGKPSLFYEEYAQVLHRWAGELSSQHVGVDPLDVEQFLFRKNGDVPLAD